MRRGVTIFEFVGILLVLALLSGMALDRFASTGHAEREFELRRTLSGMRSGIEMFREESVVSGIGRFPTVVELQTPGSILDAPIPVNPFNGSAAVRIVIIDRSDPDADRRAATGREGWAYDPMTGAFWSNCAIDGSHRW